MAAGTAQKAVLNTISTALMPEVGGIYRNLMVGMTPVNRKLQRRAVGIVVAACGCGEAEAEAALRPPAATSARPSCSSRPGARPKRAGRRWRRTAGGCGRPWGVGIGGPPRRLNRHRADAG
jgi:N-acetylmuramic acid 6-phosphate etherase